MNAQDHPHPELGPDPLLRFDQLLLRADYLINLGKTHLQLLCTLCVLQTVTIFVLILIMVFKLL
jgi:hypothetical protein